MKHHRQADNLVPFFDVFSGNEKTFLCYRLNEIGAGVAEIHHGTLPFVSRELAIETLINLLDDGDISEGRKKVAKRILERMRVDLKGSSYVFSMYLSDEKLLKVLGNHVAAGAPYELRVPFTTTREVGLQWQEFGKKYVSPETQLNYIVSLKRIKSGLWEVVAPAHLEAKIKEWLHERFAAF